MMDEMQAYFAYGSNLSVAQMAQRCADAIDPRPATLADHDWLINERGVATIEPFEGSEVHGVLWQVSDHDLEVLDSAEGVPVRYRRDRLDGPDQRRTGRTRGCTSIIASSPATPRDGYLERIIDGRGPSRAPEPMGRVPHPVGPGELAPSTRRSGTLLRRNRSRSSWQTPR